MAHSAVILSKKDILTLFRRASALAKYADSLLKPIDGRAPTAPKARRPRKVAAAKPVDAA